MFATNQWKARKTAESTTITSLTMHRNILQYKRNFKEPYMFFFFKLSVSTTWVLILTRMGIPTFQSPIKTRISCNFKTRMWQKEATKIWETIVNVLPYILQLFVLILFYLEVEGDRVKEQIREKQIFFKYTHILSGMHSNSNATPDGCFLTI